MEKNYLSEKENEFVETASRFVNGQMDSAEKVGIALTEDHRYLVNEKFKIAINFMVQLSKNYEQGFYDPRNEWACKLAHAAVQALIEQDLLYVRKNFGDFDNLW